MKLTYQPIDFHESKRHLSKHGLSIDEIYLFIFTTNGKQNEVDDETLRMLSELREVSELIELLNGGIYNLYKNKKDTNI